MTRFLTLGVLSLLAFVPSVRGEGPEDRFVRIYNLIQQADALTAQPAAVDPRELARAAEKNKALQKEVEVLKINLEKAESKPDKPVDPAVLAETRRALAAAGQKVAQQSETVATLALERDALQKRLQTFIDGIEVRTLRDESESLKRQVTDLRTR